MTGRLSRLTPERIDDIAQGIAAGLPRGVAAARAGVHRATLEQWMIRGRALRDEPPGNTCRTCGASGDDPCITANGRPARAPHTGRNMGGTPRADADLFLELVERVERAEADAHARNVAVIQRAAQAGTWQAAAWFLERRYPEQYARRTLEVSGPDKGPIPVQLDTTGLAEGVSTERLIELARRFDDPDGDGDHGER